MPLTNEKLKRLISLGENEKVDFKKTIDLSKPHQKEEFVKDVSAQANTPGGTGFLIYGVSDNKGIHGIVSSSFKETQMQQIISNWCDPKITFSAYLMTHLNKKIGIVEIPRSLTNPHQSKLTGAFFIRRGTTIDKMTTQEIILSAKRRIDNERYQVKEYDHLSPETRFYKIQEDLSQILENGKFKNKGVMQNGSYYELPVGRFQYYKPEIFEHEKSKLRMFITIEAESSEWYDLRNWFVNIQDFPDNQKKFQNPKWINIFLLIMYGSVSTTQLKTYHKYHENTFIKLKPSTYYYGLGQINKEVLKNLVHRDMHGLNYWVPKFFIMNTHSKDQLQSRLDSIPSHIGIIRKSIEEYCLTLRSSKSH